MGWIVVVLTSFSFLFIFSIAKDKSPSWIGIYRRACCLISMPSVSLNRVAKLHKF